MFGPMGAKPSHFLLYLNTDTFFDEDGAQLAQELRKALATQLPIVVAHENDPERGGCEFSRLLSSTPQHLINAGLYKALAFALYAGESHRAVGRALIAKALGAVPQKRTRNCTTSKGSQSSSRGVVCQCTKLKQAV